MVQQAQSAPEFPAMRKYFGRVAASYDETRSYKVTNEQDQLTVESYLAKLPAGSSVLDVPAGTGRYICSCLQSGLAYTGVDVSPDMIAIARAKIPAGFSNVELKVADARALPFEDDAFDYAIVIKFVKWLPTVDILIEVLREIGRVTREEALVQFKVGEKPPFSHSTRGYSEQTISDAVAAAGLHICSILPSPIRAKTRPVKFYRLSPKKPHMRRSLLVLFHQFVRLWVQKRYAKLPPFQHTFRGK